MAQRFHVPPTFIRQVRESRGLSQNELAGIVGISQPNLSANERDRRMAARAEAIMAVLEPSASEGEIRR